MNKWEMTEQKTSCIYFATVVTQCQKHTVYFPQVQTQDSKLVP